MVRRSAAGLGDRVIVLGGGPIGALVAFVCRDVGVAEVVISEPNESRRGLLASMGLEALNLDGDDLTTVLSRTDGEGFDAVFELAGVEATMLQATDLARVRGTILLGALPGTPVAARVASAVTKEQNITGSRVYESRDMEHALRILAAGRIPSEELVTREVGLTEAIPRAYEALRTRRDEMKILLTNEG
jgi:threonine dehydrogenase-like Zn-dependent dehydrogenase